MHVVVVLDGQDLEALAAFWCAALDYERRPPSPPYLALEPRSGDGFRLLLQKVDEPKAGKNRMHLDLKVDDYRPVVDRLVGLGATVVSPSEIVEDDVRWLVLNDPEGNEFCVISPL
jgi:predicted enzyme related to lactoylglutathione lyase